MKKNQNRERALSNGIYRFYYKALQLLNLCGVTLFCLIVIGCDRYQPKPLCSSIVDHKTLGNVLYGPSGTVLDRETGTIWYRCAGGSYFSQNTCAGDAFKLSWLDAVAYATELSSVSGVEWRLATLPEVRSIISPSCVGPAVNPNVFPGLKSANIWTYSKSRIQSDTFRCSISTYNGAYSCKELKKIEKSFLLVHDSSNLLDGDSFRKSFFVGEGEAFVPLDMLDINRRYSPRLESH